MNPAFSAQQLKEFLPLFQRTIGKVFTIACLRRLVCAEIVKVVEKWKAEINGEPDAVILVDKWLARSALDIVGEGTHELPDFVHGSKLTTSYSFI